MNDKYWYVEISATPEGMVNVEKYCTDSLLHSYVDKSGMLHKRIRVASNFNLNGLHCKTILFDYMEETGGLDRYGATLSVGNKKGVDWVGNTDRAYNLLYTKSGRLASVYTDSSNVNMLLNIKENKGRLVNKKKEIPTNRVELCVKKCIKSVLKIAKKVDNIEPLKIKEGIKINGGVL